MTKQMSTAEYVSDMLSRVKAPYAICMSYHPHLPIKGTLLKYGSYDTVKAYTEYMRKRYAESGYQGEADEIVCFIADEGEIIRAMECTGIVADIFERKLEQSGAGVIRHYLNGQKGVEVIHSKSAG